MLGIFPEFPASRSALDARGSGKHSLGALISAETICTHLSMRPHTATKHHGGAGRNRTDDKGFAVLGLTTWLPRPNP